MNKEENLTKLTEEEEKRVGDDAKDRFSYNNLAGGGDYKSSINLKRIGYIAGATSELLRCKEEKEELLEALEKAVEEIKEWFRLSVSYHKEKWERYYNESPEMKPIRTALSKHRATSVGK